MTEPTTDANVADASTADAGISSIAEGMQDTPDPAAGPVSTVDDVPAKADVVDPGKAKAEPAAVAATKDGEPVRFDQHPDWQRMMKERDDARIEAAVAKAKLEAVAPKTEPLPKELPYKDITKMSKEELVEWQEDDPKGYAANLYAQIKYEQKQELAREQAEQTQTSSIKKTYETYEKENPDFRKMWDSGKIMEFMNQNPGHNAISAHMAMTVQARIDAAKTTAAKEAEERVTKNFAAKRHAQVISDGADGARASKSEPDKEIKDTKQHGGITAVLASRLRAMRQAAA